MTLKFVFYNYTENLIYVLLSCSRHECRRGEYIEKLPKNKHSTKALGITEPDPKSSVLRKDGVEVPVGKGVSTCRNDVSLLYNEYPFVSCWKQFYGSKSMYFPLSSFFVVLFLRSSAPPFQPSYPTNSTGQDSAVVKCIHRVLAGPRGFHKTHVTTPIVITGLHMRHGISFIGMPYMLNRGTFTDCVKSKLSSACYALRSVKPYVTINTLKMIYHFYFYSIMTYGLLFWGISPDSIKIFRLQKKIIRIMMGCRSKDSCRKLFFNLEILTLPFNTVFPFFYLW